MFLIPTILCTLNLPAAVAYIYAVEVFLKLEKCKNFLEYCMCQHSVLAQTLFFPRRALVALALDNLPDGLGQGRALV